MRISKRRAFFLMGALLLSGLVSMQSINCPLSARMDYNDSAIYQYIGYLLTRGGTPYLDAFDHKGIYFYFLNALGYALHPRWGMFPLIWLGMFGNALLLFRTARKFMDRASSALLTAVLVSAIGCNFWEGNIPDYFAVCFLLAASFFLSDYFLSGTLTRRAAFLTGVFSAVSFWMKPNIMVSVLALCACLLIRFLSSGRFSLAGMCVGMYLGGFALATLPGLLWLYTRGALSAMLQDYFLFNADYSFFHTSFARIRSSWKYIFSVPAPRLCGLFLLAALASVFSMGGYAGQGFTLVEK